MVSGELLLMSSMGVGTDTSVRAPLRDAVVWRRGAEDYAAFRIPALARTLNGSLIAFAEGPARCAAIVRHLSPLAVPWVFCPYARYLLCQPRTCGCRR